MSCIFCKYFSSCGGMAEICEHFELRDAREKKHKVRKIHSMTIKEAAEMNNMSVTEFLELIGKLEREGKAKVKIL